ncbi:MAG: hypothetical protein U0232_27165 [Thermomicrobiales bacterium]
MPAVAVAAGTAFSITLLNTTTTADPQTRVYGQTIPLHAVVATSPATSCIVNTGNVTFTIKQGATTIGTVPSVPVMAPGTSMPPIRRRHR